MVLNYDCVRDTLLFLEKENNVNGLDNAFSMRPVSLKMLLKSDELPYSEEDIFYTLYQLNDEGLIETSGYLRKAGRIVNFNVINITPAGQKMLNDIKDPKVNEFIKKSKEIVSSMSMQTLIKTASSLASAYIMAKAHIG